MTFLRSVPRDPGLRQFVHFPQLIVCNPQDITVNYLRSKEFSVASGGRPNGWDLAGGSGRRSSGGGKVARVGAMGAAPTKCKRPPAETVRMLGLETDGCPAQAISLDPHDFLNTENISLEYGK
jgi:hypothetical protein